jgi:hypothetical protein
MKKGAAMSVAQAAKNSPALFGSEGELVLLQISVDHRRVEDLLDALTRLDFPVNPRLSHQSAVLTVELPAYSGRVDEVRGVLAAAGLDARLEIAGALA